MFTRRILRGQQGGAARRSLPPSAPTTYRCTLRRRYKHVGNHRHGRPPYDATLPLKLASTHRSKAHHGHQRRGAHFARQLRQVARRERHTSHY
ncbi:hypothetical protein KCP73_18585 [Salmonella enterica subsp. enterica]|nr:hypothetical protein KCP73_18585 [Salmonella enterica subsp. enterica]